MAKLCSSYSSFRADKIYQIDHIFMMMCFGSRARGGGRDQSYSREGSVFGLWPTPTSNCGKHSGMQEGAKHQRIDKKGRRNECYKISSKSTSTQEELSYHIAKCPRPEGYPVISRNLPFPYASTLHQKRPPMKKPTIYGLSNQVFHAL